MSNEAYIVIRIVRKIAMEMNLADAKARFSEVVDRAVAGESVGILRRGKLVARVVPVDVETAAKTKIDVDDLRRFVATLPKPDSSVDLIREMRDDARY